MQDIAFGVEQMTLDQYIDGLSRIQLAVAGETTAERAQALVAEMLRAGLAPSGELSASDLPGFASE